MVPHHLSDVVSNKAIAMYGQREIYRDSMDSRLPAHLHLDRFVADSPQVELARKNRDGSSLWRRT